MRQAEINILKYSFMEYLKSNQKVFSFRVQCNLEERIKTGYSIIFPGIEKYKFYLRFFFSRIAQRIDYSPVKIFLYRTIGVKIGKGVFISPDVILDPHFPKLIELQDYCILGWGAKLFNHEFASDTYRFGRIKIGRGVILGAYSIVRGGVEIGEMSEVPFGLIVKKDIRPNTNPKTLIKHYLTTFKE